MIRNITSVTNKTTLIHKAYLRHIMCLDIVEILVTKTITKLITKTRKTIELFYIYGERSRGTVRVGGHEVSKSRTDLVMIMIIISYVMGLVQVLTKRLKSKSEKQN